VAHLVTILEEEGVGLYRVRARLRTALLGISTDEGSEEGQTVGPCTAATSPTTRETTPCHIGVATVERRGSCGQVGRRAPLRRLSRCGSRIEDDRTWNCVRSFTRVTTSAPGLRVARARSTP